MEEITIVRRRSRLWPILFVLILLALAVLAALWLLGGPAPVDFGFNQFVELASKDGTAG